MNTLNYWLGKLNKLQLFGHGIKGLKVVDTAGNKYLVKEVRAHDEEVIITVYSKE